VRFIHDVFWNGKPHDLPRNPHEPPFWMMVPAGLLALLCLLVGVLPSTTVGALLAVAAGPVVGGPLPEYSLAIWHGLNLPLLMSALALAAGAAFYFSLQRIDRLHEHVHLPRGAKEVFDALLGAVLGGARFFTLKVVNGHLHRYLTFAVLATFVAVGLPWLGRGGFVPDVDAALPAPLAIVLWLLGCSGALGALVWHRQRFVATLFVGLTGLVVSLVFALLSAPDVALTQLLVEVASVLLAMLSLHFLPKLSPPEPGFARRAADAAIAGITGCGIGALAYAVLVRPPDASIAPWFLANAIPGAAGQNAVNVIIVDFRGLDTLGEVAVLGIAALLVALLLAQVTGAQAPSRRTADGGGGGGGDDSGAPATGDPRPLMLETVGPVLLPLAAVLAIWFFIRGHNDPGGGFIGGLTLALGMLVPFIGRGIDWVESRVRLQLQRWIGVGLAFATLSGIASFVVGHPFLTSHYFEGELPLLGKSSLASAMFFDLGVFVAVAGATLLALTTIGRMERR